jgi:hypothetical protein
MSQQKAADQPGRSYHQAVGLRGAGLHLTQPPRA